MRLGGRVTNKSWVVSLLVGVVLVLLNVKDSTSDSCFAQLYALDPLLSGITFPEGKSTGVVDDWQYEQPDADLVYTVQNNIVRLLVAPQANRSSAIVSLGTEDTIRRSYQITDNVKQFTPYFSINYPNKLLPLAIAQDINGSRIIWTYMNDTQPKLNQTSPNNSFTPLLANTYLIRIVDSRNPNFERIVKLFISGLSEIVSIRWDVVRDTSGLSICKIESDPSSVFPSIENDEFFGSTPGWVKAAVGVLFFFFLIDLFLALYVLIQLKRRANYAAL